MPAPVLRRENKLRVMKIIFTQGPLTRVQLRRFTRLSLSTLSYIIRELQEDNLVAVAENKVQRGRPSQIVWINPNAWSVIGIKIGREEVRGTLFNAAMKPIKTHRVRVLSHLRNNDGYTAILKQIISQLLMENVMGVGICSSGIVGNGKILISHLMNVKNLEIKNLLEKDFSLKNIVLTNDVDALCYSLSHQMKKEDFLVVSYGTGIGASFWSNGQAKHFEIGHAIVSGEGKCYCGQTGCLEFHASEYAVLKSFLGREIEFEDFVMNEEEKYRPYTEQMRSLVKNNFESMKLHYEKPFRMLSIVLGNLLMVLKPSVVFFLGEGMVNEKMVEFLKEFVQERFNQEFINNSIFRLASADWEYGVALAVVNKFLPEIVK